MLNAGLGIAFLLMVLTPCVIAVRAGGRITREEAGEDVVGIVATEPVPEISVVLQAVQGLSHHDEIPQVVQELTPQHSAVELHVLGQAAAAEAAKADARALRAEARVALEKARVASVKAEEATKAAEIAQDLIQRHPDAVTRPGSSQAA